ncbi:mediator complex, subunit Med18 [Peziza echinospora]|nr:mediator complex, subunit Med18 [Peziza echinospora]
MQELSLYALIPNARHTQVLRIFSGLCNMNPEPHFMHHLIYKPRRPKPLQMMGGSAPEMYYLQMISKIEDVDELEARIAERRERREKEKRERGDDSAEVKEEEKKDGEDGDGDGEDGDPPIYDIKNQKWTIRFLDFPVAMGTRPVTTRNMFLAEVGDGDALAFMEDLGYTYVSEYVTTGHTLYHNNMIINLTQTLVTNLTTPPHQILPRDTNLRNIDPAKAWICDVSLRVAQVGSTGSGNKDQLDTTNLGVQELRAFQALLKGVGIELEMGDRLSLDTRVK